MYNIPNSLQPPLPPFLAVQSLQGRQRPQEVARTLISARIPIQVQLVVLLGSPPLACGRNLGHDAVVPPLFVGLLRDFARDLLLLVVVIVDGGPVLGSRVGALTVERGGVVGAVEELEELAVRDLLGLKDELYGFGVWGFPQSVCDDCWLVRVGSERTSRLPTAHGAVRRVVQVTTDVAYFGI